MTRYDASNLTAFASRVLERAGLAPDRAGVVAGILVEGDLLGHSTHGLALLAPYAEELLAGEMAASGEPEVMSDRGAAIAWNAKRLPGVWITVKALELASERARIYGVATVSIQQSHHIAALAAYLAPIAEAGLVGVIMTSDPNGASVAPFGGTAPVMTPNPIAATWPTTDGPVILDVSMSVTANGVVNRYARAGEKLPGQWLIDRDGRPTDDPAVASQGGTVLPLGGLDAGHKGYALGLWVEAMTSGLSGYGRARPSVGKWGASVMVQVLDPAAFGGLDAFVAEADFLRAASLASPPADAARPVRVPGQAALARRAAGLRDGVELHPEIPAQLDRIAQKLELPAPAAKGA